MGMVSSREFISLFFEKENMNLELNQDYGEINCVFTRSVKLEEYPIQKNPVRAFNHPTGFLVAGSKSDPNKSYVELYVNSDIGGLLPQRLVDAALPGQQISYLNILLKEAKRCFDIFLKSSN